MTDTPAGQSISYCPPIVISVHGIRTAAKWQKLLGDTLSVQGVKHRAYDFGHFDLGRFFRNSARQQKINEFHEFYGALANEGSLGIDLANYCARPSIVAHSFGTYIVGYAMQKFPDIRFDKVVLCGSILPVDFDWSTLFDRDQVNFVRNEYGVHDYWTSVAGAFVPDAGGSGSEGFRRISSSVVSQERFDYYKHSDFFCRPHIETHWLPILRREPSPFQIRHGRNLQDDEFAAALSAARAIDKSVFSTSPGYEKLRLPVGLSKTWIEVNPDIYTFLFDRRMRKFCGYINAMPVDDQCFDKLLKGHLRDNEITSLDINPFLPDQLIKLYLMSIAIDPAVRRAREGLFQEPIERLLNGFIGKLYYYAVNNGVRITEIASIVWTVPGSSAWHSVWSLQVEITMVIQFFGWTLRQAPPKRHDLYSQVCRN
jgi:pimeloyl-ACP methyl ester carboxylesterase